jgi:hypothetical protein
MARYKPATPAQIAAREAQRKYEAAMREKATPGPNLDAMALPANTDIEARKIGRETYARRAPWYDRVLTKGSPGYRAYERLLDLHAVAMGEDGGADNVVGYVSAAGSHELTNDRRIRAGREKAAVLALVPGMVDTRHAVERQKSKLLLEVLLEMVQGNFVDNLILHDREKRPYRVSVATWNAAVWLTFRIKKPENASGKVRMATMALALAFSEIDNGVRARGAA